MQFSRHRAILLMVAASGFLSSHALADPMESTAPGASETTSSTSTTTSTTSTTSTVPSAPAQGEQLTGTTTTSSTSTTADPAAKTDPAALLYAESVAPGPFEAKRKLLLTSIKVAKKQNFGVTGYLTEMAKIEDQIKQGGSGPQLEARIDAVGEGLQDQLKRSQILKTQRAVPGSVSHSAGVGSTTSGAPGGSKKGMDQIISQLRAKYGDKIPSNIDDSMKEKFLSDPDAARELMKRFGK